MTTDHDKLKQLDHSYLWHPFTQMQEWMGEEPCIISRARRQFLDRCSRPKVFGRGVFALVQRSRPSQKRARRRAPRAARADCPFDVSRLEPCAGNSARGKIDRHRAEGFAAGVLLRQRRHRRRDRAEDGGAILATQRGKTAHARSLRWRNLITATRWAR